MTKWFLVAAFGWFWSELCNRWGWGFGRLMCGLVLYAVITSTIDDWLKVRRFNRRSRRESLRVLPFPQAERSSSAPREAEHQAADAGDRS